MHTIMNILHKLMDIGNNRFGKNKNEQNDDTKKTFTTETTFQRYNVKFICNSTEFQ